MTYEHYLKRVNTVCVALNKIHTAYAIDKRNANDKFLFVYKVMSSLTLAISIVGLGIDLSKPTSTLQRIIMIQVVVYNFIAVVMSNYLSTKRYEYWVARHGNSAKDFLDISTDIGFKEIDIPFEAVVKNKFDNALDHAPLIPEHNELKFYGSLSRSESRESVGEEVYLNP